VSRGIGYLLVFTGLVISTIGWYLLRGVVGFRGGLGAIGLLLVLIILGGGLYLLSTILILIGSLAIRGEGGVPRAVGLLLIAAPAIYTFLMAGGPVDWLTILPLLGAIHIPSGLMLVTGRRLGFALGILLILLLGYIGYALLPTV